MNHDRYAKQEFYYLLQLDNYDIGYQSMRSNGTPGHPSYQEISIDYLIDSMYNRKSNMQTRNEEPNPDARNERGRTQPRLFESFRIQHFGISNFRPSSKTETLSCGKHLP